MAIRALILSLLVIASVPAEARSLQEAIVHVESNGRPWVTGRHGEIGLMQIKCSTARSVGFRGDCRSLYSAAVNLKYGAAYLAIAVKRAGDNVCHAASLYNMGVFARPRCTAYGRAVVKAMAK